MNVVWKNPLIGHAVSELGRIIVGMEQVEHRQINGDAP